MTPKQIAEIHNFRACNVSWQIIARRLGSTVKECPAAINMPVYDKPTERQVMAWDAVQRTLPFSQQEKTDRGNDQSSLFNPLGKRINTVTAKAVYQ